MAENIVIGIYFIAILLGLLRPKLAILFFWPLMYCYPSWLLFNMLPLNVGLDDLLLISLFIGSLIRSRGRLEVKWPFVMSILFCALFVLGDLASIAMGNLNIALLWQQWLKNLGLILFVYSISSMTKTPEQISKMIYSLLFGAFLGAVFVIYYAIIPYAYNPFQIPYHLLGHEAWTKQALGPFGDTAIAGGVLGFAVLIGYFRIRFAKDRYKRPVIVIVTGVLLLGLLLSSSRSGWIFVLFPLVLSSLLSKQRVLGIFLLGTIIIVVFASLTYFRVFSTRMDATIYQITSGELHTVSSNRFEMWIEHLSKPSIKWLFFGEGFAIMGGAHVHNNYLGILKNMGLAGVLFWFVYYVKVIKKSSWLKRYDPNSDMALLFQAVFWCYIGYFIYFMPATPAMWAPVRYIDFFLMTLICLRYEQVAKQYTYQEKLDDEHLYYDQLEDEYISRSFD